MRRRIGAAGYALLDYAASLDNTVTVGADAPGQLRAQANDLLMQFRQDLTALKRERYRVVKTGELWTEDNR